MLWVFADIMSPSWTCLRYTPIPIEVQDMNCITSVYVCSYNCCSIWHSRQETKGFGRWYSNKASPLAEDQTLETREDKSEKGVSGCSCCSGRIGHRRACPHLELFPRFWRIELCPAHHHRRRDCRRHRKRPGHIRCGWRVSLYRAQGGRYPG